MLLQMHKNIYLYQQVQKTWKRIYIFEPGFLFKFSHGF